MRADASYFMVAIVFLAAAVAAAEPGASCAEIADDARRLACYDREAGRTAATDSEPDREEDGKDDGADVSPAESPEDADSAMGESPPKPSRNETGAEDAFGLTQDRPRDAELEQIQAVIAEIGTLHGNKRQFSLDNGQVWLEVSATPQLRLSPGDPVRIERGAFGSYRLFGTGKTSTRVTRHE